MGEEELIKGCINEDKACQYELYKLYAGKMMVVCLRYARNTQEAEDILQEGFVKVYDNISRFRFTGSFEGWIRRIMVNTALKNFRRSSFKNEQVGIAEDYDMPEEAHIIDRLGEKDLLGMIESLPEGYRVVFNLYAIEGFSHKEIADLLGINEGTSRSQLVKARKLLQKKIYMRETVMNA